MLVVDPLYSRAVNPRLVYALEAQHVPIVPRIYTASFPFQASAAGAELPATLNERVPADTLIKSVEFTIQQPNLFTGNILKPQRDAYFQACTYFEIEAETFGGPPSECIKITVDGPMPLEHFACGAGTNLNNFRSPFGEQFVLGMDMNMRLLCRTLNALAGNEVPTTVKLTFKCEQLDACCLRTISLEEAMEWINSKERKEALGFVR